MEYLFAHHTNQTKMGIYYNAGLSGSAHTASAIADFNTGSDQNWFVCSGQYETD